MNKLLTILLLISLHCRAANYYVSSAGNDQASGTQAAPWKTLSKVNSVQLVAGDSVLFRCGDTFNGTLSPAGAGIVFASYGTGANPVISAGVTVTGWVAIGGGLFEAPLSSEPSLVVVNGKQYAPGRFPNTGWLTIDATNGNNITSSGISGQTGLTGAKVVIRKNRFIIEKELITGQTGNTIAFNPLVYGANQGFGFFLSGKQSFCDQFGEWYYNQSTHKLTAFMGSAIVPVSASQNARCIDLAGNTDLKFIGLDITQANEDGVNLSNTDRISFTACRFYHHGQTAIVGGDQFNKHLTISGCSFSWVNGDGVKLYGADNTGLLITGNSFRNMGMLLGEGGTNQYRAISLENNASTGAVISYNTIDSVGYNGINGGATGSLITRNTITNFCIFMDDGGAIYTQEASGTNKRITENFIRGGGALAAQGTPDGGNQAMGIYSDASNAFTEIAGNAVSGCGFGIYIDDSHDMNVHDNTLYNNETGFAVEYLGHNPITGFKSKKNTILQIQPGSHCFAPQNQAAGPSIGTWGIIDSNRYCRPLDDTRTIYTWSGSGNGQELTVDQWKPVYGYDAHSRKSPKAATASTQIRYETNPSDQPRTVSLGATYISTDSVFYAGTIVLQPWTAKCLIYHSGALAINNGPLQGPPAPVKITKAWQDGSGIQVLLYSARVERVSVQLYNTLGQELSRKSLLLRSGNNSFHISTNYKGLVLLRTSGDFMAITQKVLLK